MSRIMTEDLIGEVEYIIGQIEAGIKERGWIKLDFNADDLTKFQAIRKHLTESDLAHWMDRCHELEAELAKKPTVGREETRQLERDIREAIKEEAYTSTPLNHVLLAIDHWHKKRGITVSDKEGA